jgi:hypothetical protein
MATRYLGNPVQSPQDRNVRTRTGVSELMRKADAGSVYQ